jgi:serine/threonine protein kinase/formylglycine-generating enzyme required for sulfatase activity
VSTKLSAEDLERLDVLFERGADLDSEEHAAFVERECGSNAALRNELTRLLAGLTGEDILCKVRPEMPSRAGTEIGPYRLIERIGQGGMGEVYAADQLEPVTRRVALKLIKPGMDSAEIVARFYAERQALARMDHPNIAQVFDAGATDDGRPYFVMEFVGGDSITEHCDGKGLTTPERLALFLGVCDGVQHAHQKGVIHRDLKPSNLLVADQNERTVVKIIDFGVARATTGRLTERTLHTSVGQILGTLDYMSPEQAHPGAVDIDTRTDIYSLGVVLYELVTGLLPFERETSSPLTPTGGQHALLAKDPPTPSARLRRSKGRASTLAALRGADERTLARQLTGDLDWICMKALERDPARRYASASELAEDLRRHLANEPVLAGRPGALYRARKFVRRNRVSVTVVALLTVGSLVGTYAVEAARFDAKSNAMVARALQPMADAGSLRKLTLDADELWPPYPDMLPALGEWQQRARTLTSGLSAYREERATLRARALPWTDEEKAHDRESYSRADELAFKTAELKARLQMIEAGMEVESLEEAYARAEILEAEIAPMEWERERRRTYNFVEEGDRAQHEMLNGLVVGLEGFIDPRTGLFGDEAVSVEHGWSVPRRIRVAKELEAGFAAGGEYAEAWSEARSAIHVAYPDLKPIPEMGFVPLGPDPISGLWEFAALLSGDPAVRPDPDGPLVRTDSTGLVFVLLRAKQSFLMGAQRNHPELDNFDDFDNFGNNDLNRREEPTVEVDVRAFFLSKYEMTQAQWTYCTGMNPSLYQLDDDQRGAWVPHRPNNPVNLVDWPDCKRVLEWLELTLPTERQWEYGARAGTTTIWWTGDDPSDLRGAAQLARVPSVPGEPVVTITSVGTYPANPFGLHDVMGNASEWCENPPYIYGTEVGSQAETQILRAIRGSNPHAGVFEARSAARYVLSIEQKTPALGLRPAWTPDL